ncbi:hypothetical protein KY284_036238 [Solanum tuberosum]|nr:hypothetical protein KY284_036238 [Solanum tuberosum]
MRYSISANHLTVCTCGGNRKVEEEQKKQRQVSSTSHLGSNSASFTSRVSKPQFLLNYYPSHLKFTENTGDPKNTGPRKTAAHA